MVHFRPNIMCPATANPQHRLSLFFVTWTICIVLQFSGAASAAPLEMAVPIDGKPFMAHLLEVHVDQIQLATAEGKKLFPVGDLVAWGAQHDVQREALILLRDGSLLTVFVDWSIEMDALLVESDIWKQTRIPRQLVRGILLKVPSDAIARDKVLDEMMLSSDRLDQCVLFENDIVRGTIVASDKEAINIHAESQSASIPRATLRAIIFRSLTERRHDVSQKWSVGFRQGDSLLVDAVNVNRAGGQIKYNPGLTFIPWKPETLLGEICFLRPPTDRFVYLSDMKPTRYKHVPLLDLSWPYHVDRNVLGQRLRHADCLYGKGLGLHSKSSLTYALNGQFIRFEANIGLDDVTQDNGSVICRVYVDPGPGWQLAFQSPILRGGQSLIPVSVDVTNAQRISLIVDHSDQGDEWDHVNWINARVVKKTTD